MNQTVPTATPIADAVRQYLDHDAWNYDVREREGVVMFGATVTLPNGEFRVSFDADDGLEVMPQSLHVDFGNSCR